MTRAPLVLAAVAALALGAFFAGRASVDTDRGRSAAEARGIAEGRAVGIREGRALQQPVPGRRAFRAGYVAGANDVFGGFDGGWSLGTPYAITLGKGSNGIAYTIKDRSKLPK